MKLILKYLALMPLLVLAAGCVAVPDVAQPDAAQRIKKVAVVSVVGDVFVRTYMGITVFGNERHERRISDWGLDDEYERQLVAALSALPGVSAVKVSANRQAFASVNTGGDPVWHLIQKTILQQCSELGVDGVLVLVKSGDRSIGMHAQRKPPEQPRSSLWVAANLGLFDCSSGRAIAARFVAEDMPTTLIKRHMIWPRMDAPADWPWYGEWAPETYDKARLALLKLPQKSLQTTVRIIWTGKP